MQKRSYALKNRYAIRCTSYINERNKYEKINIIYFDKHNSAYAFELAIIVN